jgi:hypothetical protein
MKKQNWNSNKLALLATFLVLPFLAACGEGGDDGGKKASNDSVTTSSSGSGVGTGLLCFALILTSGDDGCASSAGSGSSGSTNDPHALNRSVRYVLNAEVEPNDDRSNANVLNFLRSSLPDGYTAAGAVNSASDTVDYFTKAPIATRHFRIVLCADGSSMICNQYSEIDSLTAYIDVLDSTGNVIASSQAADRNLVEPLLHAGTQYFVRVVAGDTMGSTVAYQLTAHEFEPNDEG